MARVKIKTANSKDPRRKSKLLEILSTNNIYVTRIITVNDGFVVLTDSDSDMDRIFNNKTDKELKEKDFQPQIPPQLKANRSIKAFRVDSYIYNHTEDAIIQELTEKNEWVGNITQLYKFPNSNILKITFDESSKALKAQETGLLLFSMRIPRYDIEQDKFHNILTCFRCYAIEDHSVNQCPKDKDYKICSECGIVGHIWRECKAEEKFCINCKGQHGAMQMRCPKRKEVVNGKRKEEREEKKTGYSAAAKKNIQGAPTVASGQNLAIPKTHNTILQCMLHAHYINMTYPGSYEEEVNIMFKSNNLPTLKVPKDPPSAAIIAKMQEMEEVETYEEAVEDMEEEIPQEVRTEISTHEQEVNVEKKRHTGTRKKKKVKGTDMGLTLITPRSIGWPKELDEQQILKGIQENKYKFTYTDDKIDDTELLILIEGGAIDFTNCFTMAEDSIFSKIRSGLVEDKTPPPTERHGKKHCKELKVSK